MTLPATVDSQESIPEGFEDHYQKDGSQWTLAVNGIKEHPKVTSLSRAYEEEKDKRKELSGRLQQFGDVTPDDVEQLREELAEARDGDDVDVEAKISEVKEKVASKYEDQLDEKDSKLEKFRSALHRRTVESELDRALDEVGVRTEFKPAVRSLLKEQYDPTMVEEDGDMVGVFEQSPDGIPGKRPIEDFVSEWSETEQATHYLESSGKSGSGASPSASGNGASPGTETVQMDGATVRADPDKVLSGEQTVEP